VAILRYTNEAGEEDVVHVGPDRPKVLIGRSKECDLKTKNNTVSRQHAAVEWRGGTYVLQDLGSANGTFYRRQRVLEVELEHGQDFYCGTFCIGFSLDERDRTTEEPPPVPPRDREPPAMRKATTAPHPLGAAPPRADSTAAARPGAMPSRPVEKPVSAPLTSTIGYDVPGVQRAPSGPDEALEDVTFAVEEEPVEEPPPGPVEPAGPGLPAGDATEMVKFQERPGTAEVQRLLKAEREREAREQALNAEIERLQGQIQVRDDQIRRLSLQVEELGRVVARYESAQADEGDTQVKVADLERILAATETEKTALEEALQQAKTELEEVRARADALHEETRAVQEELEAVRADRDRLAAQIEALEGEVAERDLRIEGLAREVQEAREEARREVESGARSELDAARGRIAELASRLQAMEAEVAAARESAARLETEKTALEEEMQRWEALKREFESERTEARMEREALRHQVAELTARLADAAGSAQQVADLEGRLKAANEELAQVKLANRSYLKKISRLIEETERLKSASPEPASRSADAEIQALQQENQSLQAQVGSLKTELAEARDQVRRLMERLAAAESQAAPPMDLAGVSRIVERVNELVSESRTSLDVVTGLVPDLMQRVSEIPEAGEIASQIEAAAAALAESIQTLKREAVEARALMKGAK